MFLDIKITCTKKIKVMFYTANVNVIPQKFSVYLCINWCHLRGTTTAGSLCVTDVSEKFKPTRNLLLTGPVLSPAGSGI